MSQYNTPKNTSDKLQKEVPFSYLFLTIDFLSRFLVLYFYMNSYLQPWLFWVLQLAGIPLLVVITLFSNGREKKLKKSFREKEKISEDIEIDLKVKDQPLSILILLMIVISGTYLSFIAIPSLDTIWKLLLGLAVFLVYGFYALMIYTQSYGVIIRSM